MELDKLGVGSIVEVNGNLYKKRGFGWVVLEESVPAFMGGVQVFEPIYLVEKGPLDDFEEGDVITFTASGRVRVAVRLREDFWQVAGALSEFTSEELAGLADEGSVRKVGSLDGGS